MPVAVGRVRVWYDVVSLLSGSTLPTHHIQVTAVEDGKRKWAIRCGCPVGVVATSYRWHTAGVTLTSSFSAPDTSCADCGMTMQGRKGGLDPAQLPVGLWWVDHLCTSVETINQDMVRAAKIYSKGRWLLHEMDKNVKRGWLTWEAGLAGTASLVAMLPAVCGGVDYLHALVVLASIHPMTYVRDLLSVCESMGGREVFQLAHITNRLHQGKPVVLETALGKSLVESSDPLFREHGVLAEFIDWNSQISSLTCDAELQVMAADKALLSNSPEVPLSTIAKKFWIQKSGISLWLLVELVQLDHTTDTGTELWRCRNVGLVEGIMELLSDEKRIICIV
eukprot:c16548_g1_i1.p2 GENE.c16548_g1_i1~~c16548_g1_i1.p2  ORF type:complete len:336 (+),score=50.48 c16548_g1_i1:845-1852(+)